MSFIPPILMIIFLLFAARSSLGDNQCAGFTSSPFFLLTSVCAPAIIRPFGLFFPNVTQ